MFNLISAPESDHKKCYKYICTSKNISLPPILGKEPKPQLHASYKMQPSETPVKSKSRNCRRIDMLTTSCLGESDYYEIIFSKPNQTT